MHCPQKLSHVLIRGDNLYQLAKHYRTTVPSILSQNPDLDPYNLKVGTAVTVCPGEEFLMQSQNPKPVACPDASKQMALSQDMRLVWEQHVYWTRMLLLSIADRLKDQDAVTARLLQNPDDIANIFANYYSRGVAEKISRLLTEHLQIGAELITALRDSKKAEAEQLNRKWYINADQMADAFSSINPYYNREQLREMLHTHLQLATQEVALCLAMKYREEVGAFEKVEQEALMMADYFSSGIMQQFPQSFSYSQTI